MDCINKKLTNYTVVLLIYNWQYLHTKIVTYLLYLNGCNT
jgi:hypothetical protein